MMKTQSKRIFTALAAALLLLSSNVLAGVLTDRFGLRLDLTDKQLYTLSADTLEVLPLTEGPVVIRVFNSETDVLPLLRETLSRYALSGGGKVSVQYIDPYAHPDQVSEYTAQGYVVAENTIAVQGERCCRVIQLDELFETDADGNVTHLKIEQALTPAILFASRSEPRPMQFIEGHDESYSASLAALFTQNNYSVGRVTLSVQSPEAGLLVLANPQRDLEAGEISKLDAFLNDGGDMLVFLSQVSASLPNLRAFLNEWGIDVTDTAVAETLQYVDANPLAIVPVYASHPINRLFVNTRLYPVLTHTVALNQLYTRNGTVSTAKVLYSSDRAFAESGTSAEPPFVLSLTSEKALQGKKARLFVSGSSGLYADSLMQTSSYANMDFIAQAIAWCADEPDAVSIPVRDVQRIPLAVTAGQLTTISVAVVLLPSVLLLVIGGMVVYRRRRL